MRRMSMNVPETLERRPRQGDLAPTPRGAVRLHVDHPVSVARRIAVRRFLLAADLGHVSGHSGRGAPFPAGPCACPVGIARRERQRNFKMLRAGTEAAPLHPWG